MMNRKLLNYCIVYNKFLILCLRLKRTALVIKLVLSLIKYIFELNLNKILLIGQIHIFILMNDSY
jgi:hypothetical protein